MFVTSFSTKFRGNMFISLKVISVVEKKRKTRDEKTLNKKKSKVMTQFLRFAYLKFKNPFAGAF